MIWAATPLSQLRRHGSHSFGRLISLSLVVVKLQHSTFVQSWSTFSRSEEGSRGKMCDYEQEQEKEQKKELELELAKEQE